LRARLLGALRTGGPATATTLAGTLGTNTGATSYHLRKLADVGLVAEDEARAETGGRERWWRAVHDVSSFSASDFSDDPDAFAALDWFRQWAARHIFEGYSSWLTSGEPDPGWRDAAGMSDWSLRIGPARLETLNKELWSVIERYRDAPAEDEPDARHVAIAYLAYPRDEGS
jgi:hypothetical protein